MKFPIIIWKNNPVMFQSPPTRTSEAFWGIHPFCSGSCQTLGFFHLAFTNLRRIARSRISQHREVTSVQPWPKDRYHLHEWYSSFKCPHYLNFTQVKIDQWNSRGFLLWNSETTSTAKLHTLRLSMTTQTSFLATHPSHTSTVRPWLQKSDVLKEYPILRVMDDLWPLSHCPTHVKSEPCGRCGNENSGEYCNAPTQSLDSW